MSSKKKKSIGAFSLQKSKFLLYKIKKNILYTLIKPVLILILLILFYNIYIFITLKTSKGNYFQKGIDRRFNSLEKDGKESALLLIHGFAGSPIDFKPLIKRLEEKNYSYKLLVLPGHGTKPQDLKDVKKDAWIAETCKAYDELKIKYKNVSVIGFSMGGVLSLILATERPVEKLILISPYFKVRYKWFYILKPETWSKLFYRFIPYVKKVKIGQINDPDGLKNYLSYKHIPNKSVIQLTELGQVGITKAGKVKCDTLWLHSVNDIVANFTLSRRLYNKILSKKKKFIKYEKSNHILLYDYDSEDVMNNIMNFLNKGSQYQAK